MIAGPDPESGRDPAGPKPGRGAWVKFIVGIALLALAGWVLASRGGMVSQAWDSARSSPPWLIASALALPVANLLIIALSFWLLMRREGAIGFGEMIGVIGAAWLLNFAPLRPGLLGRLAYHRAVNKIPVTRALVVTMVGIAAGGAAVLSTLILAAALGSNGSRSLWAAALAFPAILGLGVTAWLRVRRVDAWVYAATYSLRYLDVLVLVARYAVLFALTGSPTTLSGAVVFAAVCQVTLVVPMVGNGLGIREWAIAFTAAALPAGLLSAAGSPRDAGLVADLANRAAEIVVALPIGVISTLWLAARVKRSGCLASTASTAG